MADEKTPVNVQTPAENKGATAAPKSYTYSGPKPAPLISNLPLDLKQPTLGTHAAKNPADQLLDRLGPAYVEYVMRTNTTAKGWWK